MADETFEDGREHARHWTLDPDVTFLNHGSFGACPRPVLDAQTAWRARLEAEPVRFFARDYQDLLDEARNTLASFVGASPEDMAFVPNSTTGVNAVLRSLRLRPGDEILVTDHAYGACRNTARYVAERAAGQVVVASLPYPAASPDELVEAILAAVTPRTRVALVEQVTSPTAMVLPVDRIVAALAERGVDTLVDAAHAVGMIPLELSATGAAWTVGNCHKWLCAPKGAGFLHARRDRHADLHPVSISHGLTAPTTLTGRSRFHLEFDWTGTDDPSAYLSVPEAIRTLRSLHPDGWPGLRRRNRALARAGRDLLCDALGVSPRLPDDMLGFMATVRLPDGPAVAGRAPLIDPLQDRLWEAHRIEVPVITWPEQPARLIRISAHLYNALEDYERLAAALPDLLE